MTKENHPGFMKRHRASFWLSLLSYPIASLVAYLLSLFFTICRNYLPLLLPEALWVLIPSYSTTVCTYCLVLSLNVISALLFADRAMSAEKAKGNTE